MHSLTRHQAPMTPQRSYGENDGQVSADACSCYSKPHYAHTHYPSVETRQNNTLHKPDKSDYTVPKAYRCYQPDKDIRSGGGRKAILSGGTALKGLNQYNSATIHIDSGTHYQFASSLWSQVCSTKMEKMANQYREIVATTIIAGSSRSHYSR